MDNDSIGQGTWQKRKYRNPDNMKIRRMTIKLTESEYAQLTTLAEAHHKTLSDYVVQMALYRFPT
jgi:uncharacterized protein (DUF1778 family)